jgi:hypothetical protein
MRERLFREESSHLYAKLTGWPTKTLLLFRPPCSGFSILKVSFEGTGNSSTNPNYLEVVSRPVLDCCEFMRI